MKTSSKPACKQYERQNERRSIKKSDSSVRSVQHNCQQPLAVKTFYQVPSPSSFLCFALTFIPYLLQHSKTFNWMSCSHSSSTPISRAKRNTVRFSYKGGKKQPSCIKTYLYKHFQYMASFCWTNHIWCILGQNTGNDRYKALKTGTQSKKQAMQLKDNLQKRI